MKPTDYTLHIQVSPRGSYIMPWTNPGGWPKSGITGGENVFQWTIAK